MSGFILPSLSLMHSGLGTVGANGRVSITASTGILHDAPRLERPLSSVETDGMESGRL
jgi:hypothetical protein